jgi:membrane dipeptidase
MKIVDLHCDTLYKFYEDNNYSFFENDGHISENALIKGDYLAQCFAIYIPQDITGEDAFTFFERQYESFINLKNSSNVLGNKIKAILTVENAELLNGKLNRIDYLRERQVKILGLIHNGENCLGFPHSKDEISSNKPLKNFGREVIDALNSTNITADVSHLNLGGFMDVANLSKKPFIASHSGCREIVDHSRNLYDFQIKKIANSGGIVGVPFYSYFLNGTNKTEIADIIHHLERLINIGGENVAAIGTDFDGMECELPLKSAGDIQLLVDAIIKKFGLKIAEKICYKNALRILE